MSPAAPAQVRVPAQRRVRHESQPRRLFTVVPLPASAPSWLVNPMVLGPMILAATLAFIIVGYGVLTERQMALTTITAQVQSESLAHDKALLKVETMQSPLRITSDQVAANRLVPPVAIVEVPAVSLDTPVRPIAYVYEPKFVPPAPLPVTPAQPGAPSDATTGTTTTPTSPIAPVATVATSSTQQHTATGALPPTVGQ